MSAETARRAPKIFSRKRIVPTALSGSELARTVPDDEFQALDRLTTKIQISAGEQIMQVDELGRECFVVIDGEFEIQLDDTEITVGSGAVIGELALLTLRPRTASVTAVVDSWVYVLNRTEFATVLDVCPSLSRYIHDGAARRSAAA